MTESQVFVGLGSHYFWVDFCVHCVTDFGALGGDFYVDLYVWSWYYFGYRFFEFWVDSWCLACVVPIYAWDVIPYGGVWLLGFPMLWSWFCIEYQLCRFLCGFLMFGCCCMWWDLGVGFTLMLGWYVVGFRCCVLSVVIANNFSIWLLLLYVEGEPLINGRMLPCNLEVTDSNSKNSLSAHKDKFAYIYISQTPPRGSLMHWTILLLSPCVCSVCIKSDCILLMFTALYYLFFDIVYIVLITYHCSLNMSIICVTQMTIFTWIYLPSTNV